jgi:hypothetical protein
MTEQSAGDDLPSLFDTGNHFLTPGGPVNLVVGLDDRLPDAGVATIRIPNVTLTLFLDEPGAEEFVRVFTDLRNLVRNRAAQAPAAENGSG